MENPNRIYELLLDRCVTAEVAEQVLIGLVWTLCRSGDHAGLCMSPQVPTRTLDWPSGLTGKPLADIAAWTVSWEPYQTAIAMAAINCCLNAKPLPHSVTLDNTGDNANLAVFDYFLPQLVNKKVVVIGRYPGLEQYQDRLDLKVLEFNPGPGDYPAAACEYLIPRADWVFITASSIPNKTFPRLAELAANATSVLMGPTAPWLPELGEFGINYLAGVEITDPSLLYRTIAEGGGKRIFSNGLRYRVAGLSPENNMQPRKNLLKQCIP